MRGNFVRIHSTNLYGLGATKLGLNLIPKLEASKYAKVSKVYLPDSGELSFYGEPDSDIEYSVYRRFLPKLLSRTYECLFSRYFDDKSPILVLGDLPIRTSSPQVVFVQNSNILIERTRVFSFDEIKYSFARFIFKVNIDYPYAFIVQTEVMKTQLIKSFPKIAGRVHVVPQPVPDWLARSGLRRNQSFDYDRSQAKGLRLFYPAAGYPHKNHVLLSRIRSSDKWSIDQLILTVDCNKNPCPKLPWVKCVGVIDSKSMISQYAEVDGLLFLSKKESFGFPLLEAMYVGLPIICPDLPYSRVLCGHQAIYFDPDSVTSLKSAVDKLARLLESGWWPNYQKRLEQMPRSWDVVADRMLDIVTRQD